MLKKNTDTVPVTKTQTIAALGSKEIKSNKQKAALMK